MLNSKIKKRLSVRKAFFNFLVGTILRFGMLLLLIPCSDLGNRYTRLYHHNVANLGKKLRYSNTSQRYTQWVVLWQFLL